MTQNGILGSILGIKESNETNFEVLELHRDPYEKTNKKTEKDSQPGQNANVQENR